VSWTSSAPKSAEVAWQATRIPGSCQLGGSSPPSRWA
jgi:hypothetical protein